MHRDWPCAQAKLRLTSRSFVITFGCTSFYAEQVQWQQTLNGPKLPNSPNRVTVVPPPNLRGIDGDWATTQHQGFLDNAC
jgi:hypothetical protein